MNNNNNSNSSNNKNNTKKNKNNYNNNKYKSQKDKVKKSSPNQTILTPPLISQLNITSPTLSSSSTTTSNNTGRQTPPLFQLNNNINNSNENVLNNNTTTTTTTTTTTNKEIPGYYYDPEKNRYFKLTNDIKQKLADQKKKEKEKFEVESKINQTTNNHLIYGTANGNNSSNSSNENVSSTAVIGIDQLLLQREFNLDKYSSNPYHIQRYASDLMLNSEMTVCQSFEINALKGLTQSLPLYDALVSGPSTTSHGLVFTRNDSLGYVVFKLNNNSSSSKKTKNRIVNSLTAAVTPTATGNQDDDEEGTTFTLSSIAYFFCKSNICGMSQSPLDNKMVAVGTFGGGLSLFSIIPYQDEMITETMNKTLDTGVYSCCWNPKRNQVVYGTYGNSVLWDIESNSLSNTWLSKSDILCQDFNSSGDLLFNGSRDGYIRPIDQRSKRPLSSLFLNQSSSVYDIHCLPDDNYILSASLNNTICKWDLRVGKQVIVYPHHKNNVNVSKMSISPDKRYICAPGDDRFVRIWNCSDGSLLKTLGPFTEPIKMVQFIDHWSPTIGNTSIYFPTLLISTNKGIEIYSYPGG